MGYYTRVQVKQMLDQAPPELNRAKIVEALVKQGHVLEGLNDQGFQGQMQEQSQGKSLGGFAGNVVKSAGNLIGGVAQAVMNPIDTAKTLGKTALGGVQKLIPGEQDSEQNFDQLTEFFKQRYGSWEAVKETAYNDPVGFLADASTVIGGTGAAIRGAGAVTRSSSLARAGQAVGRVGAAIDPITATTRATTAVAGKVAAPLLGATTGAGTAAIKEGMAAAKQGGKAQEAFVSAMRRPGDGSEIVTAAKSALDDMFEARRTQYQSDLAKVKAVDTTSTALTTKGVKDVATKTFKDVGLEAKAGVIDFSKRPTLDSANLQKLSDFVYSWQDMTPLGLDQLLQEIRGFRKGGVNLSPADNRFNFIVDKMTDNLKTYTEQRVPQLKPLRENYGKATSAIKEIQKELSIGDTKSTDSAIRKLMSTMRTNNEFRLELLKKLQEYGGDNITAQIAGQTMSEVMPRGLMRQAVAGTAAISVGTIMSALPFLATASPRIVGEFLNFLGNLSRTTGKVEGARNAIQAGRIVQQAKEEDEE